MVKGLAMIEKFSKPPIVSGESQELTDLCCRLGDLPIFNSSNLGRVDVNALIADYMAQKLNRIQPEITLRKFCIQLLLFEQPQYQPQVLLMFFLRFRVDKNVVNEYNDTL